MYIEDIAFNEESFLYLERYVNDGSPSGFTDIYTVSEHTSPFCLDKGFDLYSLQQKSGDTIIEYGNKPDFFKWNMLIHPDMYGVVKDRFVNKQALYVSPTSSSRTVKCLENPNWYLKLAYKGLIGRIDRTIGERQALSSVEVSSMIEKAIDKNILSKSFYFLREPFAKIIRRNDDVWGIILRETMPYPYNSDIKFQIPAFALFSKDRHNPDHPSILKQLILRNKVDIENYLLTSIIFPIYDSYFSLLLNCGLQLECHAQNTLFAIDKNFNVIGVISKDAESIDKDIFLMESFGIHHDIESLDYKCLNKTDYNYQIMHSFMFDFKLGEYLISPIINEASKHFKINSQYIQEQIQRHNRYYIGQLPPDFFPKEWYYYENIVHDRTKKRPYIYQDTPKYR